MQASHKTAHWLCWGCVALLAWPGCQLAPDRSPQVSLVARDTVQLQLVRLDAGAGDVLVSSGIPLPPGYLWPGANANVALVVAGAEESISVEILSPTHGDGSARGFLIQFRHSLVAGTPVPALLLVGSQVTRGTPDRPKTPVTWSRPAAVALPVSADYLVRTQLVGLTLPVAQSPATPPAFPTYESDFVTFGDQHWAGEGGDWVYNYYDRALIWYAWWVRTGDSRYWDRGTIDAVAYRRDYLEPNGYALQPHNSQLEGLELHYLLTGDERSRYAIARVAELFALIWTPYLGDINDTYVEGRIQARTLLSHYLAWRLNAVGDSPRDWQALMEQDVTKIVQTQQPDGSYRFGAWEGQHSNYMTGLVHDALIKYYTFAQADARIPTALKKTLDWMWATQWVPAARGFKYVSGAMSTGDETPAADLNMLIVTGYGWYYQLSRDATYRVRGDDIFTGGVDLAWLNGYKQFNQNYTSSFRYLLYRQ